MEELIMCRRCMLHKCKSNFASSGIGFEKKRYAWYCNQCVSDKTRQKRVEFKKQCLDYKGGTCMSCGYNRCVESLEFHHRDPKQKDFAISIKAYKEFSQKVKDELDKCDVLCRNCHTEEHYKIKNEKYDKILLDNIITLQSVDEDS